MKDEGLETTELGTQKIKPKTKNWYCSIPIPDFMIEEIEIVRKRYDT